MREFILLLGPETMLVKAKSMKSLRKRLNNLANKKISPNREDHIAFEFKGHKYCRAELRSAEIMSTQAYLKLLRK